MNSKKKKFEYFHLFEVSIENKTAVRQTIFATFEILL